LPREQFQLPQAEQLLKLLDETARRSAVSRAVAFEDFLHMSVCALSGGQMEEQYLATVAKHAKGKPGQRGCDSIAELFARCIEMSEQTHGEMIDVLGDLFQGSITYGENGQFFTPPAIARMMGQMTVGELTPEERAAKKSVYDPACGSGRMLLGVAEQCPHWTFVGKDTDLRCVRLTSLNLGLRNLYGYVIHGNSLTNEDWLVYRTGFNGLGVIQELKLEQCPSAVQQAATETPVAAPNPGNEPRPVVEPVVTRPTEPSIPPTPVIDDQPASKPKGQLRLF
jgi:hypothetical protein